MGVPPAKTLPPQNYRRLIDEYAALMPDPVLKLKFIKRALSGSRRIPGPYRLYPTFGELALRNTLLREAERLSPGSRILAADLTKRGIISSPHPTLRNVYRFRHPILLIVVAGMIWALGGAAASLNGLIPSAGVPAAGKDPVGNVARGAPESAQTARGALKRVPDGDSADREAQGQDVDEKGDLPPTDSPKDRESLPGEPLGESASVVTAFIPETLPGDVVGVRQEEREGAAENGRGGEAGPSEREHEGPDEVDEGPGRDPAAGAETAAGSAQTSEEDTGSGLAGKGSVGDPDDELPAAAGTSEDKGGREGISGSAIGEEGRVLEPDPGAGTRLAALNPALLERSAAEKKAPPAGSRSLERETLPEYLEEAIWLVEKGPDEEVYSNGLQIITSSVVDSEPRRYITFPISSDERPDEDSASSEIHGILYHASESDLVPFRCEENQKIKEYSRLLRQYVARNKMYHYLVDPFGRVFRIVREEHAAFHAGNSVWADEEQIFLNLNHAFLGICFEGKGFEHVTDSGSGKPRITAMGTSVVNEAQERSGKVLTDWLRVKYRIPQRNCVPHGLASVYPEDRLIGYHLDLSYGFPFHRLGLRNKYSELLPSMVEYGFTYDRYFSKIFEGDLWPGIRMSEELLKKRAGLAGMSVGEYRKSLQLRFDRHTEWQRELLGKLDGVSKDETAGWKPGGS